MRHDEDGCYGTKWKVFTTPSSRGNVAANVLEIRKPSVREKLRRNSWAMPLKQLKALTPVIHTKTFFLCEMCISGLPLVATFLEIEVNDAHNATNNLCLGSFVPMRHQLLLNALLASRLALTAGTWEQCTGYCHLCRHSHKDMRIDKQLFLIMTVHRFILCKQSRRMWIKTPHH